LLPKLKPPEASLRLYHARAEEAGMDLSLEGRRALVTAGAAGIGRVIAQTFSEHGARVQVCDVDEKALTALPREIFRVRADVASLADVERLFEEAKKNLGGLDILVNNAGIAGPTAKVEDIRPEDWERCIAVDLNGMFYCTRKAMPMIKAAGGGSIVNLSSAAGKHGFPQRSPYAAAKWAVVGFTKSVAIEAGPDKVRVNCIQPGIGEGESARRERGGVPREVPRDDEPALDRHAAGHRRHGALPVLQRGRAHHRPGDRGGRRHALSGVKGKPHGSRTRKSHHHVRRDGLDPHAHHVALPADHARRDRAGRDRGGPRRRGDRAPARARPEGR